MASRDDRLEPSLRRIFGFRAVIRNVAPASTLERPTQQDKASRSVREHAPSRRPFGFGRRRIGSVAVAPVEAACSFISLALLRLLIAASAAFLSRMRHGNQLRTFGRILGTDSTRSFYFAVQQLSVLVVLRYQSLSPRSCRCPLPRISNSCGSYPSCMESTALEGFGRACGAVCAARWSKPRNSAPIRAISGCSRSCPTTCSRRPALVVVLHGCGQTAAGYDLGAGWSTLAKHYGFALLMPEQQPSQQRQRLLQLVQSGRHQRAAAAKPARSGR